MKSNEIFTKTMPFVWAKLLLGLATILCSIVIFAVLMGVAWLFNNDGVSGIMLLIWLSATGTIQFFFMHYIGYLLKAGHIAVIVEAVTTGNIPSNQVEYGKGKVKERFVTSNVYFAIDKLVSGAVRQLQNVLEKAGNTLGFVPGMDTVVKIGKMFIGISLGYIDECCLGYTFYKKDQGEFKSAADGVVIYAQNWKRLLKDAAKTTITVIILIAMIILVTFLGFGLVFRLLNWNGFVAFLLACFVAAAVKSAFIDSYMMVKMMTSYMEVAPSTNITFDLYGKMCEMSSKFKDLWNKAEKENPTLEHVKDQSVNAEGSAEEKPVFCGACGAKNRGGTKFCGSCGKPI